MAGTPRHSRAGGNPGKWNMKDLAAIVFILCIIPVTVLFVLLNQRTGKFYHFKIPFLIIGGLMTLIVLFSYLPLMLFSPRTVNIGSEVIAFVVWLLPSLMLLITGFVLKKSKSNVRHPHR
ncbi:MAG: hypothetical protein MUF78_07120 [Candidatus Edwardsbacteria bacterium]|jgi:EamA domain-containing membrane protein RarD|nr:hypothetical protein [Candidatus Edwardsbacteria bacterium]